MKAKAGTTTVADALKSRTVGGLRLAAVLLCLPVAAASPEPGLIQLNQTGRVLAAGRSAPFIVHHLPVTSFPRIPGIVQAEMTERGCLVPQTYEAHRPENVIHGSFERAGSSDWAVLCSVRGTVSLLVFFASDPRHPAILASAPETERLQARDATGMLGFNWGIDAATPRQIYDAQAGMHPRPPRVDHDAVADSIVEHRTEYHYYSNGAWTLLSMPD